MKADKVAIFVIALLSSLCCSSLSFGQKVKAVEGTYTYWVPRHVSRAAAEQTALERAMVEAIGREFGTLVNQQTQLNLSSSEGGESSDFYSYASTLLKGEWIETIGEPEFDIRLDADKEIVVSCKVKGKAREIRHSQVDLDVKVLCNGTTDEHEAATFIHNDRCYLAFISPIDGYISVYLEDDSGNMFRMLPFAGEKSSTRRIDGGKRYVFFTSNDGIEEQYRLQTDKSSERNTLYVVFSPKQFVKPIDYAGSDELDLNVLKTSDFMKWLNKTRALDHEMQFVVRPLTVVSKNE